MKRERKNQKARTRAALLEAARELAADGAEITVQTVADRAGISRATAYRYFSDPGFLAVEAALDVKVRATEELLEGVEDVRARVHAITDYYRDFGREHEPAFRKFFAKVMDMWTPDGSDRVRGARRIPALEMALEPVRESLSDADFRDLVMMLTSSATGFEQHIALADVCGLDRVEADRIARKVVDAILDSYTIA